MRTWFASALCLVGPAVGAVAEETALDKALQAFKQGELTRVLTLAEAVAEGHADYARVQYLVGETQLVLGAHKEAERAFIAVLDQRPEAVPALVGLGRAQARQGAFEEAELQLRAALELDEQDLGATRALGEVLMWTARYKEARAVLNAVYERGREDPLSARALVELHLRVGETAQAAEVAARLAKKRAKHAMGPFLRALVHEGAGETDQAIASYQLALERDERFLDAHKNLAILCHTQSDTYQIQARNELALKHYARYFELGGRDKELQLMYEALRKFLKPDEQ